MLLDPHLETLMDLLTSRARVIILGVYQRRCDEAAAAAGGGGAAAFPFQMTREPQMAALFRVLYNLCRCRGCKTIVKFFPHEVSDLEPTLMVLQCQDRNDFESWGEGGEGGARGG